MVRSDSKFNRPFGAALLIASLAFFGCATTERPEVSDLRSQLEQKDQDISILKSDIKDKDALIEQYGAKLSMESKAAAEAEMRAKAAEERRKEAVMAPEVSSEVPLLPPDAKPGECYARVFIPPVYKTSTEQVLKRQASEKVEIIPAKYDWVKEKVLVKEASERIEVVPAEYSWVTEDVLVKEASKRMVEIPAKYGWVEEKMLVKPAHTVWKKGRGLIEKVDNTTGEIMCLVEIPATYKTVKKRILETPANARTVEIPAAYKTVRKKVMVKPPTTRKIQIPAEYTTVKVRKMVSSPKEQRISIPAEYQMVTRTEMVSDGRMEWRRVLCETNATPNLISKIQSALIKFGHNPGPIDGIFGKQTKASVKSYQKDKGLAVGGLTYSTIESLGIKPHR